MVKNTISDESIEKLRDHCTEIRDLAIIDLLYSTGIRVGELVNLNIDDIDLEGRECIVYGKGDKERRVYFDAKASTGLEEYIEGRKDENKALFVTLDAPYDRLKISGVEIRLRQLGRKLGFGKNNTRISSDGLWQPELLIKECLLNRCKKYLDIHKLTQLCSMQWLIRTM